MLMWKVKVLVFCGGRQLHSTHGCGGLALWVIDDLAMCSFLRMEVGVDHPPCGMDIPLTEWAIIAGGDEICTQRNVATSMRET